MVLFLLLSRRRSDLCGEGSLSDDQLPAFYLLSFHCFLFKEKRRKKICDRFLFFGRVFNPSAVSDKLVRGRQSATALGQLYSARTSLHRVYGWSAFFNDQGPLDHSPGIKRSYDLGGETKS